MIKKVYNISDINISSPLFPLIYADFPHLQDSDGVFFQETEKGKTLLISMKNGSLTICKLSDDYDGDELLSFINFWGVKTVLTDFDNEEIGLNSKPLMVAACCDCENDKETTFLSSKTTFKEYKELFSLLSQDGGSFENWYVVVSKKINNGYSQGVIIKDSERIISTALTTAVYSETAIISGVFTLPEYRNNGCASKCIKALLSELKNKNVSSALLWCEKEKVNFYKRLGFAVIGEVYVKEDM